LRGSFEAMGQLPGLGVVLGGVLIVGLVLAWRSRIGRERRTLTATGALLIGALLFLAASTVERADPYMLYYATASHYLDVLAALVLPGIAVAADAIARRWRILLPAMLALLLIGIPGNLQKLARPTGPYQAPTEIAFRNVLLEIAFVPIADSLPRSYQLYPYYPGVTLGWLLDQKAAGRLPGPPRVSAQREATLTLSLALKQSTGTPKNQGCNLLLKPVTLRLQKAESLWFEGGDLEVRYITRQFVSSPIPLYWTSGRRLTALAGPLTLTFASSSVSLPAALCRG